MLVDGQFDAYVCTVIIKVKKTLTIDKYLHGHKKARMVVICQ